MMSSDTKIRRLRCQVNNENEEESGDTSDNDTGSSSELTIIIEYGNFSIVMLLIFRSTRREHQNKQFKTQGLCSFLYISSELSTKKEEKNNSQNKGG